MRKTLSTFLTLILFCCLTQAQTVSGWVKDAKTGEPLPYVNVGILMMQAVTV
jgi:hypothetical protein